jgi:hypothetical protein
MKRIGLMIAFVAVLAIILPLTAQDAKKDADKKDKTPLKTDPDAKKDVPKDPEKKDEKKAPSLAKWFKDNAGPKVLTKIVSMKGETNREYTIEIHELDQKKVYDFKQWQAQTLYNLNQQQINIGKINPKDFQGRQNALINYNKALAQYQADLNVRQTQVYTTKNTDVRAHEQAKVRSMTLPVEFDDTGNIKKWTKKEIEERKDKSGLPGYFPSDFDALKAGQHVEMYMAKVAPKKKDDAKKKKGPDDDDPGTKTGAGTPEFLLIVILPEGKQ